LLTPYQIHQFPNGIRLVHRQTGSPVAHVGVVVNAGARDEMPDEQGMAHFIEHLIFKGTESRSARQVLDRIENVGADLNAFTTKEDTSVYASFLPVYYGRTLELFSDILFNSTFPDAELKKEKDVVIDEINSYKDSPMDWIHDEFDEIIFGNHPLGKNILGTPAHLKRFGRDQALAFTRRQYFTNHMVISSVGSIPFSKLVYLAGKYFGSHPGHEGRPERLLPPEYCKQEMTRKFSKHQSHIVIGNRAYSYHDKSRYALALLTNLLGGPAMNSTLNLILREKHGIAYNLESNYQPLSDTGIFTIYLGTDTKMVEKAIYLVTRELQKLRENKMSVNRLRISKEQLKGQIAISVEAHQNEMLSAGKSLILFDKVDTIEEVTARIEAINASDLLEVANDIFDPVKLSTLIYSNGKK
jgi:predicted Zn-dependent peptidase